MGPSRSRHDSYEEQIKCDRMHCLRKRPVHEVRTMHVSGSSLIPTRVGQRLRSRFGFEIGRSARKKATSKFVVSSMGSTPTDMKGMVVEENGKPRDSFPSAAAATGSRMSGPDEPSAGNGVENQLDVINAECSYALPRAVPVAVSAVDKSLQPDPDPEPQSEDQSNTSSPETPAPQSPSSTVTVSRYQLCFLLNRVVDVVAAAAQGDSADYDFSMLESLAPHLEQQDSNNATDGDQITMTHNKLNLIVTSLVQGTKASVVNKTSLPSGIELPGMGPNGRTVHLSWPPDPPGEYRPQMSST